MREHTVTDVTLVRALSLIHFALEYVEVVGRCHSNDVILGMPGSVEDLLVEVQTVHADLILLTFATRAHLTGLQDLHGHAILPRRLQCDVLPVVTVKHPEEVVVRASHHHTEKKGEEMRSRNGHAAVFYSTKKKQNIK